MDASDRLFQDRRPYAVLLLSLLSAAIALVPSWEGKLMLAAPFGIVLFCVWVLRRSDRWLIVFLCTLVVLPPLPIQMGDSGPHPSLLIFCLGLLSLCVHAQQWKRFAGVLGMLLCGFTGTLFLSILTAMITSGPEIGFGSLCRVLLFTLTPSVFFFSLNAPGLHHKRALLVTRYLFRAAMVSALFACADFYFQFPTPAGFGPQFVWLDQGVFRRAQGLFYEASTLGNFCAFFLVMVFVALRRRSADLPVRRAELRIGAIVFATALIFSYSRGALLNLLTAALAFAVLNRKRAGRLAVFFAVCLVLCPVLVYLLFPAFAQSYLSRLFQSLAFIWSTPNGVLSGRVDSWQRLLQFLVEQPWRVVFGIGYKTLPYSDLVGSNLIADNTYLSLLIELGIGGLLLFLALNVEILRRSLTAYRSSPAETSFFAEWIFCFWIGELVQMASGDLITYWRLLPLYFWVLAIALRLNLHQAGESRAVGSNLFLEPGPSGMAIRLR
jgi:O-antigen ligase